MKYRKGKIQPHSPPIFARLLRDGNKFGCEDLLNIEIGTDEEENKIELKFVIVWHVFTLVTILPLGLYETVLDKV